MCISRYPFVRRPYLFQLADQSAERYEALVIQRRATQQQHSVLVQERKKPFGIPVAGIESIVGGQPASKSDRSEFLNSHSPFSDCLGGYPKNHVSDDSAHSQASHISST